MAWGVVCQMDAGVKGNIEGECEDGFGFGKRMAGGREDR